MKTRISKLKALLILTMIISTGTLMAQHNHGGHNHGGSTHEHKTPPHHGGQMKETGKYHIEMVSNLMYKKDKLSFYLFQKNLKPISNEEITGTITIEYKDGTTKTETLQKRGDDYFAGQLERTDAFSCTVKFTIKGKVISAVFSLQVLNVGKTIIYTCSMHPEIEQNKSGACPKCGMKLIEKQ